MPTCDTAGDGAISGLQQELLSDVPGASGVAKRVMQRAAQEFFQRSERWRVTLSLNITGEVVEYTIPTPTRGRVYRVISCTKATSLEPIDSHRTIPTKGNDGAEFFIQTDNTIRFSKPVDDVSVDLWVSLAPELGLANQHILTEYRETILDGAKQYAYGSNGNDLFDPTLSDYYRNLFNQGIVSASRYYESSSAVQGRPPYSRIDADLTYRQYRRNRYRR